MSAIVPIKVGDEVEVDRAKLTEHAVLVRKDGVWIELKPPNGKTEAEQRALELRKVFDQICDSVKVGQGVGPPVAFFQTPPDASGNIKRFVYQSFDGTGPIEQGAFVNSYGTFEHAAAAAAKAFNDWLEPNRTLVWRQKPELNIADDGRWQVFFRCVQLDNNADHLVVDWYF